MTAPQLPERPWFHEGLRFECTRCGQCCTGEPGFVWVNDDEIQQIADFVGEPVDTFRAVRTRVAARGRTLRETSHGDCVFYDAALGCTIYPVRPRQCRTWPFWSSTAGSPSAWQRTQTMCPGSGHGELVSAEEITRRMRLIEL